jgi:hypothetical protein
MSESVVVDDRWLGAFAAALRTARGNDRFVKVRAFFQLISAWHAARAISPDTIAAARVDADTGMVPWSALADIMSEAAMGRSLGPPTTSSPGAVDGATSHGAPSTQARERLRRREDAARALGAAPPLPLVDGTVTLRRHVGDQSEVLLTLDRITASGLLVRLSAELLLPRDQGDVVVRGDAARATGPLLSTLERAAQLPAPAIAVQLAGHADVGLLRLTRGVIGPARVAGVGARLNAYGGDDDAIVVMGFEELAADITATTDNDVFADDDLGALLSALPGRLQHLRGFRDARVIATAGAAARVQARADAKGVKPVITVM